MGQYSLKGFGTWRHYMNLGEPFFDMKIFTRKKKKKREKETLNQTYGKYTI